MLKLLYALLYWLLGGIIAFPSLDPCLFKKFFSVTLSVWAPATMTTRIKKKAEQSNKKLYGHSLSSDL